jgi:hypothetical protein
MLASSLANRSVKKLTASIGDIQENIRRLKKVAWYSGFGCRFSGTAGFPCLLIQLKLANPRTQLEVFLTLSILVDFASFLLWLAPGGAVGFPLFALPAGQRKWSKAKQYLWINPKM